MLKNCDRPISITQLGVQGFLSFSDRYKNHDITVFQKPHKKVRY